MAQQVANPTIVPNPLSGIMNALGQVGTSVAGAAIGAALGAGLGYALAKDPIDRKLFTAIGAIGGGAAGGTTGYLVSKYTQKTGTYEVNPQIQTATQQVTITATYVLGIQAGVGYSPTAIAVTGSGFDKGVGLLYGGPVQIFDENGDKIYSGYADTSGNINFQIPVASYRPSAGLGSITALDVNTNTKSNAVSITYVAGGPASVPGTVTISGLTAQQIAGAVFGYDVKVSGSASTTAQGGSISKYHVDWGVVGIGYDYPSLPQVNNYALAGTYAITVTAYDNYSNSGSSTTQISINSGQVPSGPQPTAAPGNILLPSAWTRQGAYSDNTNPVSFGNWAVANGGVYGVNFLYGAGYYQNPDGSAEMYFGTPTDATNWLTSKGYPTTMPIVGPGGVSAGFTPGTGFAVGGLDFYYYTGDVLQLSAQSAVIQGGTPFYPAYNGFVGNGYYWFVGHNALTAQVITSANQLASYSNALGSVNLSSPQGVPVS